MTQFDFSVVTTGEFRRWLLSGLGLSLQLTAISLALSLPTATIVALSRLSSVKVLRGLGAMYVETIRNIPLLVHLLFWYFAMPELLPEAAKNWLYEHDAESVCAIIALTLRRSVSRQLVSGEWKPSASRPSPT
jgi:polar amino acid transport system permease protein